jgi:uncharacterized membrane protein YphA (DoxX/SURF4 family)
MPRFPSNAACFSIRHLSNRLTTDIEMSKGFTTFLGVADLVGGLGVILGVKAQLAAAGLIVIMLGAIAKKIFATNGGGNLFLMKCSSHRGVTFARVILRRSARPPRLHVAFDRAPLR